MVTLSEDALSVQHNDATDEAMQGVVFGDAPLPRLALRSQYFEVKVDSLRAGFPDGLVIGVTSDIPCTAEPIHCADEIPASWSFGYDGAFLKNAPLETDDGEVRMVKMRSNASLYRVSRFSKSAFRISYKKSKEDVPEEEDDEDEDIATQESMQLQAKLKDKQETMRTHEEGQEEEEEDEDEDETKMQEAAKAAHEAKAAKKGAGGGGGKKRGTCAPGK